MNVIYKLWLTLCSLLLTSTVFLVKENIYFSDLSKYIDNNSIKTFVEAIPVTLSCVLYFCLVVICTLISLYITRFLSDEQIPPNRITTIESANDAFLPSYLGYFFVVLSANDHGTFLYVFSLIFVFIFFSKISYFNPIFLLLGYKFFYLTNKDGLKIVVITKKELKIPNQVNFYNLKRINNYTFITTE